MDFVKDRIRTCVSIIKRVHEVEEVQVEIIIRLHRGAKSQNALWNRKCRTHLIVSSINPRQLLPDIDRRLLERRRRIQIVLLESVEVEDA